MAIDRDSALAALIEHAGNVSAAARALGAPPMEMRAFINANTDVLAMALEAEERALDKAEAAIKRALRHGSLEQRMKAAKAVLRMSGRLRR
jgi:ABC-type hemin transport system substrate-binding protein